MDEFKRYVAKQNSFLIYGKTKLYEISITWIEKKKCYMLHVDKDYFCKNSEEMLTLFYCGYPLEKWICFVLGMRKQRNLHFKGISFPNIRNDAGKN